MRLIVFLIFLILISIVHLDTAGAQVTESSYQFSIPSSSKRYHWWYKPPRETVNPNSTSTTTTLPPEEDLGEGFPRDLRMLLKQLTSSDQTIERIVQRIEEEVQELANPSTDNLWVAFSVLMGVVVLGVLPALGYLLWAHIQGSDQEKAVQISPISLSRQTSLNRRSSSGSARASRNSRQGTQAVFVTQPQGGSTGLSNAFDVGASPKLPRLSTRTSRQTRMPTVSGSSQ